MNHTDGTSSGLRPETVRFLREGCPLREGLGPCLVALGDSITYGWGLQVEEAFPARLQDLLVDQRPGPWRVINAGIPGDTAMAGCLRYHRHVQPLAPQGVLISFGLNDGALRRTGADVERERQWRAQRWPWLRAGYVLGHKLAPWRSLDGEMARWELPRVRPRLFLAGLLWLAGQVRADRGQPYLISLLPVDEDALPPAQARAYWTYDALIREAARRSRAPLIDLQRATSRFQPDVMRAADGIHLTAAGQRWLAHAVREQFGGETERRC